MDRDLMKRHKNSHSIELKGDVMFDNILVAVDGSELSKEALEQAIGIIKNSNYQRKLTVVHVNAQPATKGLSVQFAIDDPEFFSKGVNLKKAIAGKIIKESQALMEKEGVDGHTVLLEGDSPSAAILDYAYDNNIDLIIVSSRGLTGLREAVMGSVSHALIQTSKISVLVIK